MYFALFRSLRNPFRRRTPPGAMPGTVVVEQDEPKPVLGVMAYGDGELFDGVAPSVDDVKKLVDTHAITWVNVDGLGDAEVIQQLGDLFGLHPLALEDVVNVHQRPKLDDYDDHVFLVARMVDASEGLQTEQIAFFVGPKFVLTFQEGIPGDCLEPVRERIRKASGRIREQGTDYLLYALLDVIIDHYFPVVEAYGERLDELDRELTEGSDGDSIASIRNYRSELLLLRRAIRPHRELINQLLRDTCELISDETRVYLRDCYDHTIQLSEAIDTYRETCSDLRDFQLTMMSNRANDVMKTLTIIATIFIPLGFIAGLYGMNFQYMPELHLRYGYPLALAFMVGTVTIMLAWFWRRGWFRG